MAKLTPKYDVVIQKCIGNEVNIYAAPNKDIVANIAKALRVQGLDSKVIEPLGLSIQVSPIFSIDDMIQFLVDTSIELGLSYEIKK